ncbi:MAG: hypothetical protein HKM98_00965 [Gammaproteobacteria bacterium]|nr:hypothetical protein [Gammaproteobacteria bacterium]
MHEESAQEQTGTGAVARSLFPGNSASGRSFVNRGEEKKRLVDYISSARSAWFDCPPRYGVGTVTQQALKDMRYWREPRITSYSCELRQIFDARSFCNALLECTGQLASQTIRRANVEADYVEKLFVGIEKQLYLDEKLLQTIRFVPADDVLADLQQAILDLDEIAGREGCRNVYLLQDFQQIMALKDCNELLSLLRGLIEQCNNATWLISGNNQYAMQTLFAQGGAMHGCASRFILRPINSTTYAQYLSDAAQSQWNCFIGRKATAMILALTEKHPYWFNQLCQRLWSSDLPPVIQDVVTQWRELVRENRHISSRQLELLSPNQRAVLHCLAETPTNQPRAKRFVARTRISSASVGQAISILAQRDLIRRDVDDVWCVADPALQWSLFPRMDIVDTIYEDSPDLFL